LLAARQLLRRPGSLSSRYVNGMMSNRSHQIIKLCSIWGMIVTEFEFWFKCSLYFRDFWHCKISLFCARINLITKKDAISKKQKIQKTSRINLITKKDAISKKQKIQKTSSNVKPLKKSNSICYL